MCTHLSLIPRDPSASLHSPAGPKQPTHWVRGLVVAADSQALNPNGHVRDKPSAKPRHTPPCWHGPVPNTQPAQLDWPAAVVAGDWRQSCVLAGHFPFLRGGKHRLGMPEYAPSVSMHECNGPKQSTHVAGGVVVASAFVGWHASNPDGQVPSVPNWKLAHTRLLFVWQGRPAVSATPALQLLQPFTSVHGRNPVSMRLAVVMPCFSVSTHERWHVDANSVCVPVALMRRLGSEGSYLHIDRVVPVLVHSRSQACVSRGVVVVVTVEVVAGHLLHMAGHLAVKAK